jgi:hypothetical protein
LDAKFDDMDPISVAERNGQMNQESEKIPHTSNDIDEDDAVLKVEAATTPNVNAQQGVRNVEAVTLTWTKSSLAAAFIW